MQDSLIYLLLALIVVVIFLLLKQRSNNNNQSENKEAEELANLNAEIVRLKDSLNSTINTSLVQCLLHLTLYQLGLQKI
tara:strand:- start:97 stop:333 length:237 start_codon:yes stop_codon:yes gene_type:complete